MALSRCKPLRRSSLLVGRRLLFVGSAGGRLEKVKVVDFGSETRGHVCTELSFLPLVLLHQPALVCLGQVLPALVPNFLNHPQQHFFRHTVPVRPVSGWASNIFPGDIGRAIDRKRHAVCDFAAPSYLSQLPSQRQQYGKGNLPSV